MKIEEDETSGELEPRITLINTEGELKEKRTMKALIISDMTRGGAAVCAGRLCKGFEVSGCEAVWAAATGCEEDGAVIAGRWPSLKEYLVFRALTAMRVGDASLLRAQRELSESNILKFVLKRKPDVINLHNIHLAMTFKFVKKLPKDIPVVWTLHDMWPLTGYCCYSYECEKYLTGCREECPQINKWGPVFESPETGWALRHDFFRENGNRVVLVAPSKWLTRCAESCFGDMVRVECIPYGVDTDVFKPLKQCKSVCRSVLGLPENGFLVLAGAFSVKDERKGFAYIREALDELKGRIKQTVNIFKFGGQGAIEQSQDWLSGGYVHDERLLNLLYNAADVFVLPSLADNLPNTLIESIAAGTPCVTFDVGGCPETVRHGQTGFVAKYKDVNSLVACIERILLMPETEKQKMRVNCRRVAESEYALNIQAERYNKLFAEVLRNRR